MQMTSRRPRWPLWSVGLVGSWLALVATNVWLSYYRGRDVTLCMFKRLTSVPCPTCGSTRAVLHLIHGRPSEAIAMQPLMFVVGVVFAATLVFRVVFARRVSMDLTKRQRRIVWTVAAAAFLANWAYVIAFVG